ncbi:hypothetical protein B566_EDAN015544 [Ephemera danica]|nr:hypothetical protein B566_EDAN015544 [Ephemera danica]
MRTPNNQITMDLPLGAVCKDVVVIGNGPGGIALSHLLSGHWPYYTGAAHPTDEDLTARFVSEPARSLVQQDLRFLSQGLEGRCNNPVSLLFDALFHPCADMGLDVPPLISWRYHPEKRIDHVVLGRGPPGGSWQTMDGNVLTISLSKWMELPGLDFRSYGGSIGPPAGRDSRASVAALARYYSDYVRRRGIEKNFHCGTVVTSVSLLQEVMPSCKRDPETGVDIEQENPLWVVQGVQLGGDEGAPDIPFCYVSPHVVLATGNYDRPNKLNVPGDSLPFVLYSLTDMERMVAQGKLTEESDPVLVVGAGLSAADAVIAARFHGLPVIHAFRRSTSDPGFVFRQLPENMYPEYHKVHQMMVDGGTNYPGYRALPERKIMEIREDNKVRLIGMGTKSSTCYVVRVSVIVALIGAQPDLSFLPSGGTHLGVHKELPVQSRTNPVKVDPYTHQCVAAPGLYAIGSLAGDNFVRFVHGGALAITSHLHKERRQSETCTDSESQN